MLQINFQSHRPFSSREDDFFFRFLPYTGMAAILMMWRSPFGQAFIPHSKIWLKSAKRFLRKRNLKMLNMSDLGPRSVDDLDH